MASATDTSQPWARFFDFLRCLFVGVFRISGAPGRIDLRESKAELTR